MINTNTTVGDKIKSRKIVNLTSVCDQIVTIFLSRITTFNEAPIYMKLDNGLVFDAITGDPINKRRTKNLVTYVIDEDDPISEIKIKSLLSNMGLVPVTVIKISSKTKMNKPSNRSGKIIRYASYQHTKEVMDNLNACEITQSNLNTASSVTIIKTGGCRCAGVASIILACNMYDISYEIENERVKYRKTWIECPMKIKVKFEKASQVNDKLISEDYRWRKKLGYANYLNTNKGMKDTILGDAKNKIKKSVFQRIFEILKDLWAKVKSVFVPIKNKKDNSPTVAFSVIPKIVQVAPHVSAMITSTQSKNAATDIKKANKAIAGMQLNKMLAKSGISGNKTILNEKRSPAMDSYIAGMTSFNVTDAITNANNLAASRYKTVKTLSVLATISIMVPYALLFNKTFILIISIILLLVDYYADILPANQLIYVISVLLANNILVFSLNLLALITEKAISENKTASYRSLAFLIVTCMTLLV